MKRIVLVTGFFLLIWQGVVQAQNFPFPQNKVYTYGLMPTNRNSADASTAYTIWKNNFVVACGDGSYRVKFDISAETVSEGIGYGMLLSAYSGDKTVFDGLWKFYKKFSNSNGVMHWKISGCSSVIGQNGATDSDVDAAMALIVANSQWSGTYAADAKALIAAIKKNEVEASTLVLKPGDMFGGSNLTNPSYFATGYFRAFGKFTDDVTFWNGVASKAYQVIDANLNAHNAAGGLVSDWTASNGSYSSAASGYVNGGTKYTYDAARTPWRIAVDFVWNGSDNAKSYILKASNFVRINLGGSKNIKDGYNQDGTVSGQWHNSTFVGAFATAAMGGGVQSHLDDSYADLKSINDANSYFNQTLKTLYLFLLTGNFYLPGGSVVPPNNPPSIVLTAPANNTTFASPATISLTATATDNDGTVSKVEFFNGPTKIGEDLTSPYAFSWTNVGAGTYVITAKATDNGGAVTTSVVSNVTVTGSTISQKPYGGTAWPIPGKVEAEKYDEGGSSIAYNDADATNSGGQFRTDGVDVEATTDAGSGYNVGWTSAGEWLEYTVNVANSTKYDFSFRLATNATGRSLHLEADGVNITGTIAVPNTGGWQSWRTITVPGISLSLGTKVLRVVLDTDGINFNYFEAVPSSIIDPTNILPTVNITSPANNSSVAQGTTFTLVASASDQDGSIAKVEFYRGATKLTEDLTAPYSVSITDLAVGTYTFTAKAFDNKGGSATSTPVNVTLTSTPQQTGCIAQNVPVASEYVVRNAWNDNSNGSGVVTDAGALKITHRAWGMSSLWVVQSGKAVAVQSGKSYTVTFDLKNDAVNPLSTLTLGLASSVTVSGVTLAQPSTSVGGGLSSATYGTKSVSFTASTSGNVFLAWNLGWPGQPNATTNIYIKSISFCENAVASPVPPQDDLTVFPNPFTEQTSIYIKSDVVVPIAITVTDVYGNLKQSLTGTTNQEIKVGSDFVPGQYIVKVMYADKVTSGVLIKN